MIDKAKEPIQGSDKTEKLTKNFMKPRGFERKEREVSEFEERVIEVRRVARTVKGGRRIRFRALVVIGNKKGKVGAATAKANDVTEAVKKAVARAKKNFVTVPIVDGTIPYEVTFKYGSAIVMLKPAASGTSIVAGGSIRTVAELAGITDMLSKMMGSSSKVNNVYATFKAFASFKEEYVSKIKGYQNKKKATDVKEIEKAVETALEAPKEEVVAKKAPKSDVKKNAKKSMK
jgi:small subunit ribosomal protein S5